MYILIKEFICPKCGQSNYLEGKGILLCVCGYHTEYTKA